MIISSVNFMARWQTDTIYVWYRESLGDHHWKCMESW